MAMTEQEKEIKLVPKKKSFINKIKDLFVDKKKRTLYLLLFILPFVIAIGVFGFVIYKEAKSLLSLATSSSEVNPKHQIVSMGYELRDDATDYQEECFAELKSAIEDGTGSNSEIAGLVCKNFIADFYTWSNKQGQYDIGGLYYVSDMEVADDVTLKENVYLKARDTFYKYLSSYIEEYGSENLLEVENIEITSSKESSTAFTISEHVANLQDENGDWYEYCEDVEYETYLVSCKWTYKANEKFDTSKYATSLNFLVISRNGKFEIVEISEKTIDVRKVEQTENSSEE